MYPKRLICAANYTLFSLIFALIITVLGSTINAGGDDK